CVTVCTTSMTPSLATLATTAIGGGPAGGLISSAGAGAAAAADSTAASSAGLMACLPRVRATPRCYPPLAPAGKAIPRSLQEPPLRPGVRQQAEAVAPVPQGAGLVAEQEGAQQFAVAQRQQLAHRGRQQQRADAPAGQARRDEDPRQVRPAQ